ncbi:MAG: hypothetical protein AAF202_12560 [Pseudomonadota bacterium]
MSKRQIQFSIITLQILLGICCQAHAHQRASGPVAEGLNPCAWFEGLQIEDASEPFVSELSSLYAVPPREAGSFKKSLAVCDSTDEFAFSAKEFQFPTGLSPPSDS